MPIILELFVFAAVAFGIVVLVLTPGKRDEPSALSQGPLVARPDSYSAIEISARVRLTYEDADGATTTRDVLVHRYDFDGDGYIVGHCSLRQAERTFRIDRVRQMVDLDTGEQLTKGYRRFLRSKRVR